MKFSDVAASDLKEFINKTVGFDTSSEYDVFIDESEMTINIVNRNTGIGDSLSCPRIFYRKENE